MGVTSKCNSVWRVLPHERNAAYAVLVVAERNVLRAELFLLRGLLHKACCSKQIGLPWVLFAVPRREDTVQIVLFWIKRECHVWRTVPAERSTETSGPSTKRGCTVASGERCSTGHTSHGREDMKHGALCSVKSNAVFGRLHRSTLKLV
jgi:hypothetical protein